MMTAFIVPSFYHVEGHSFHRVENHNSQYNIVVPPKNFLLKIYQESVKTALHKVHDMVRDSTLDGETIRRDKWETFVAVCKKHHIIDTNHEGPTIQPTTQSRRDDH